MTVATAVGDDELLAGAARADGSVPQPEAGDGAPGHERRHEVDPPAVTATAEREQAAATGGKQRVRDAGMPQSGARTIQRVALADRAEVQLDAGAPEPDGPLIATHMHGVEPHRRACGLNCVGVGQAPLAPQEPPAPAERRRRDVKGTAGFPMNPLAGRQQVDQVARDDDGLTGGAAIDL